MFRPLSLAAVTLLLGAPAYAQDRVAAIDAAFRWAGPDSPGCAVAVSEGAGWS